MQKSSWEYSWVYDHSYKKLEESWSWWSWECLCRHSQSLFSSLSHCSVSWKPSSWLWVTSQSVSPSNICLQHHHCLFQSQDTEWPTMVPPASSCLMSSASLDTCSYLRSQLHWLKQQSPVSVLNCFIQHWHNWCLISASLLLLLSLLLWLVRLDQTRFYFIIIKCSLWLQY